MLEVIGLSAEVEQVYEVLLNARPATVRELATVTGLTQSAVRAALRALQRHGLVSRADDGTPHSYGATDPGIALGMLLLRQEEELRRARARAGEISERFRRAAAGRDPAELVEVVTGRETLVDRVDQLQRGVRRQLRCLDKPPYHPGYATAREPEREFTRGGGIARAIYDTAAVELPGRFPVIADDVAAGEQARVLPTLPIKLMLVDDRVGMVPLRIDADVPSLSYLVVHRSALLDALCDLFETLWRLALPLTLSGDGIPADERPDPTELRILGLMNAGLPDEAIARHLGLSHRTLQRRIRELMERLNVHTRYQLGVQTVLHGWTPHPAGPGAGSTGGT